MERAFINSGLVQVVQSGAMRDELRSERADQQEFASEETRKRWKQETGADYMLNGTINSIVDSEGGGIPLGERYAAAERNYISILPREHAHRLADFVREGRWEPVKGDADREAVFAHWAGPKRAAEDPRRFVLMRHCDNRRREPASVTISTAGRVKKQYTS